MTSPMHQHTRSTSSHLSMKRPQNKAAAQRLAEVMAQQPADDEEEEDELYDFSSGGPSAGIGLAGGRQARSSSPMSVRNSVDQPSSARYRPAQPKPVEPASTVASPEQQQQQPSSARYRHARSKPLEPSSNAEQQQPSSARHAPSKPVEPSTEQQQPSSARHRPSKPVEPSPSLNYSIPGRSSNQMNSSEEPPQPSSARVVGRPNLRVKTVPMVPSSVSLSLKRVASVNPADSQLDKVKDKR